MSGKELLFAVCFTPFGLFLIALLLCSSYICASHCGAYQPMEPLHQPMEVILLPLPKTAQHGSRHQLRRQCGDDGMEALLALDKGSFGLFD